MIVSVYYRVSTSTFRVDLDASTVTGARQQVARELALAGQKGRVFMAREIKQPTEHGLNRAFRTRQYIK